MDQASEVETPDFWESRYRQGKTAWETGGPASALGAWLRERKNPHGRAIVLGCGRGHDAIALAAAGFEVTAIDFASSAIRIARQEAALQSVDVDFVVADLFGLGAEFERSADLVFEHTFLSAIRPERRNDYAALVARLLKPDGLLLGVFFTGHDPDEPPFGITPRALRRLLADGFEEVSLAPVPAHLQGPLGQEHLGQFRRRRSSGVP